MTKQVAVSLALKQGKQAQSLKDIQCHKQNEGTVQARFFQRKCHTSRNTAL